MKNPSRGTGEEESCGELLGVVGQVEACSDDGAHDEAHQEELLHGLFAARDVYFARGEGGGDEVKHRILQG